MKPRAWVVSVVMEEIIISAVIIILLYHCWLYVVVVVNRITIQPKAGNAAYHTRGLPSLFKSLFNVFIITYLSLSIQKKMLCTQNQPIQIDTFFIRVLSLSTFTFYSNSYFLYSHSLYIQADTFFIHFHFILKNKFFMYFHLL